MAEPVALVLNEPLKERVYRVIQTQGPISAAAIGDEVAQERRLLGPAIGALSRAHRIKRVGYLWVVAP